MPFSSRFGTSSPDGKTTPGARRADRLAEQAAALAAKKPTQASVETMERADGPTSGTTGRDDRADRTGAATDTSMVPSPASAVQTPNDQRPIEHRAIDAVRPSPFQPRGRPSAAAVDAVRAAIAVAGSLDALISSAGTASFARLSPEAARLAELTYSIAKNGVETPIEVRTAEDGEEECLSGHRRLAAARLAGLTEVPVLSRGVLSNAQAAAKVLTGNLHREGFTAWQEAVLVTEVQAARRTDGLPADVRALGGVMGWSMGKVHQLLRARQVFTPESLARISDGDVARVEDGLARLQAADLKRLVEQPDEPSRTQAVRRALGLAATETDTPPAQRAACTHRPKRGGGFVVEVNEAVESLDVGNATLVHEVLASQLARVRARLEQLGRTPS